MLLKLPLQPNDTSSASATLFVACRLPLTANCFVISPDAQMLWRLVFAGANALPNVPPPYPLCRLGLKNACFPTISFMESLGIPQML
jgi:hypothetical protein